ncbi:unnamed protein product [Rotaria sordida]|uniref:Transcription initiation factor TFIID subunit 9 n=1 Tax=Rotaria sordida TaxID=392033 RepID=A0A818R885_9BILA|nr:unnamed protein product [Rotaria sordida]CAF3647450.1 unnamed protein product [Rotaria sordida]
MSNPSSTDEQNRLPKDGIVVQTMLQEMGITNYEPKLIPMVLDFMHQYTTDVLEEAKLYSIHAGRKQVELEDIKLACQNWAEEHSTMPSKDTLTELAKNKNRNPLPPIRNFSGPRLPADRFCLLAPNYKLKDTSNEHSTNQTTQQHGTSNNSASTTFITDHYNPLTGTITTTTASGSFASNDLFAPTNSTTTKRKMNESDDEDDNYDM